MLARLDDAEARANLAELEARRQLLANDVERISGLYKLNAATKTALDQASTSLHEFDARIDAARQRISDLVLRARSARVAVWKSVVPRPSTPQSLAGRPKRGA